MKKYLPVHVFFLAQSKMNLLFCLFVSLFWVLLWNTFDFWQFQLQLESNDPHLDLQTRTDWNQDGKASIILHVAKTLTISVRRLPSWPIVDPVLIISFILIWKVEWIWRTSSKFGNILSKSSGSRILPSFRGCKKRWLRTSKFLTWFLSAWKNSTKITDFLNGF